jgi:predicted AAA+ superfamily ATPase
MYIERELMPKLRQLAQVFPSVFLTGPRQSGKSTLLAHAFPEHRLVNLEDPDMRQFALEDPRGFISGLGPRAIIDEAQRAPELFSYLQGVLDASDETGRFVLSGSQNFMMARAVSQSLAGRVGVLSLLPLSLQELPTALFPNSAYEWMLRGGYPRLIAGRIDPADYFPSYLATYVERDVRAETGVRDLDRFSALLATLASRVGSPLNLSDVGRQIGADARTVAAWINVLTASYIVFTLPAWHVNLDKRIAKRPKLFFHDTGLLCAVLGLTTCEQLARSSSRGHVFENAVVNEIGKRYLNQGQKPRLFYASALDSSVEVDLIVETPAGLEDWEVKASQTANEKYASNLLRFDPPGTPVTSRRVVFDGPSGISRKGVPYLNWRQLVTEDIGKSAQIAAQSLDCNHELERIQG